MTLFSKEERREDGAKEAGVVEVESWRWSQDYRITGLVEW